MNKSVHGVFRHGLLALAGVALMTACGGAANESPGGGARERAQTGTAATPDLATDDVAYLSRLGLMRGHLQVGMELYRAGHVMHAKSHMKHPGDELYAALEGVFAARGSEGFAAELEALATVVENESPVAAVDAAYEDVRGAIARAESHAAAGLPTNAAVQAAIVVNLVETAAEEYGIGVAAGRVTDVHEYQDAYGFTRVAIERAGAAWDRIETPEARRVLARIADDLEEGLTALWPTLVPREPIGVEPARLEEALVRIEAAAATL